MDATREEAMDEAKGAAPRKGSRLYFEARAESLDLPELWRRYAASLAFELCGEEAEAGEALLASPGLRSADPVALIGELFASGAFEPAGRPGDLASLIKAKDAAALAKRVWAAQAEACLPLLEIERCAYINAQYGRILAVLGADYWDEAAGDYKVLWNREANAAVADPYELAASDLHRLGYLEKRLVMLGTVSVTPFFSMRAEDKERLGLVADLGDRLRRFRLCGPEELDKLFSGHELFMDR
jgi:hypothetical protein